MDFKIFDASAFYAGVPFGAVHNCYTTTSVYDEIRHIKSSHDALGTLISTNRLRIMEPGPEAVRRAVRASKETGDYRQLSEQDISIIALGIETGGQIISDDFAVSNVAKNIGVTVQPVMTGGIRDVGRWVYYCPGCRTSHGSGKECPACGTPLKRKLLKEKKKS